MSERHVVELLAAHADQLVGRSPVGKSIDCDLSADERDRLASLLQLAEELKGSMSPVEPSPAFVRTLREELVTSARTRSVKDDHRRRSVLIGAAAVGSVVSIASIVGAIVYMVSRARGRAHAPLS